MAEPTVGPPVPLATVQTSLILRGSTASSATRITNNRNLFMPPHAIEADPTPTIVNHRLRRGGHGPVSLPSATEVSERLVGSPAFKAGGTGDPRPAGSIPVHLRIPAVTALDRDRN